MGAVAGIIPDRLTLVASRNGIFRQDFTFTTTLGAFDLTGYSAEMQLRPSPGSSTLNLSISSAAPTTNGSQITFLDVVNGVMEVFVSNADLAALPANGIEPAEFSYDLVMTEPGGDFGPWLCGYFIVTEGVTR